MAFLWVQIEGSDQQILQPSDSKLQHRPPDRPPAKKIPPEIQDWLSIPGFTWAVHNDSLVSSLIDISDNIERTFKKFKHSSKGENLSGDDLEKSVSLNLIHEHEVSEMMQMDANKDGQISLIEFKVGMGLPMSLSAETSGGAKRWNELFPSEEQEGSGPSHAEKLEQLQQQVNSNSGPTTGLIERSSRAQSRQGSQWPPRYGLYGPNSRYEPEKHYKTMFGTPYPWQETCVICQYAVRRMKLTLYHMMVDDQTGLSGMDEMGAVSSVDLKEMYTTLQKMPHGKVVGCV